MTVHCQCRPHITDTVVDTMVEDFVHNQNGVPPSVGQMAKRLSIEHGKPKCEGCTCKLAHNIEAVMAKMFPESVAIAAE